MYLTFDLDLSPESPADLGQFVNDALTLGATSITVRPNLAGAEFVAIFTVANETIANAIIDRAYGPDDGRRESNKFYLDLADE